MAPAPITSLAAATALSQSMDPRVGQSFVQTTFEKTVSKAYVEETVDAATANAKQVIPGWQEGSFTYSGIYCDAFMGAIGAGLFWLSRRVATRTRSRSSQDKEGLQKRAAEAEQAFAATVSAQQPVETGKDKVEAFATVSDNEDGTDEFGCTLLHRAAAAGDIAATLELLGKGEDVDAREAWDETPLHMAARAGASEVAEALLHFGATVDVQNADDKTPLLVAGKAGHEALCSLLLDSGATAGDTSDSDIPPALAMALMRRMVSAGASAEGTLSQ